MSTEEIKNKEVINICNGDLLGYVYDIEIDMEKGKITGIVVANETGLFSSWKKGKEEYLIKWQDIIKIGEEIILVEFKNSFQNPLYVVE